VAASVVGLLIPMRPLLTLQSTVSNYQPLSALVLSYKRGGLPEYDQIANAANSDFAAFAEY